MEMKDVGRIESSSGVESKDKKEKHYPSFSLSSKQLPELKSKKFGDSIELHLKGEIEGMYEDYEDKSEASYNIKIKEIGIGGISKDKYMKMSNEEKDKEDEKEVMGKK